MNHRKNNGACATDGETLKRFKQFAWVALLTGLVAAIVLGALIHFLSTEGGTNYSEIIRAHWLAQSHLAPALWIAGLFLLSLVALITGLIAIYSSFRIAGPLYRFSRNLSVSEKHSIIGIRQDDCLQDVSRQLQDSIHSLDVHRQTIHERVKKAEACLRSADEAVVAEYAALIKQLKARLAAVKIHD